VIQIDYEVAERISLHADNPDYVKIAFTDPTFFTTADGEQLDFEEFEPYRVPKQFPSA
jgi:hypothetical protein